MALARSIGVHLLALHSSGLKLQASQHCRQISFYALHKIRKIRCIQSQSTWGLITRRICRSAGKQFEIQPHDMILQTAQPAVINDFTK